LFESGLARKAGKRRTIPAMMYVVRVGMAEYGRFKEFGAAFRRQVELKRSGMDAKVGHAHYTKKSRESCIPCKEL
jgi:hypothetical protein